MSLKAVSNIVGELRTQSSFDSRAAIKKLSDQSGSAGELDWLQQAQVIVVNSLIRRSEMVEKYVRSKKWYRIFQLYRNWESDVPPVEDFFAELANIHTAQVAHSAFFKGLTSREMAQFLNRNVDLVEASRAVHDLVKSSMI